MQSNSRRPKPECITIRMEITYDLPKEFADEVERLGIYQFDKCMFDADTKRMTAAVSTKLYRLGRGA